jgi:hypothetical protein
MANDLTTDPNTATVQQPGQLSTSSQPGDNPIAVAARVEFASVLTPCLALVGGVGMQHAARKEWLRSAYIVLGDIPPATLQRAARAAMGVADHPSKIVPAIMAEAKALMARERSIAMMEDGISETRRLVDDVRRPNPDAAEVGTLMAGLVKRLESGAEAA